MRGQRRGRHPHRHARHQGEEPLASERDGSGGGGWLTALMAAMARPGGSCVGTSLRECTATSQAPHSSHVSSSLVNSPGDAAASSASGLSSFRSPSVALVRMSISMPGNRFCDARSERGAQRGVAVDAADAPHLKKQKPRLRLMLVLHGLGQAAAWQRTCRAQAHLKQGLDVHCLDHGELRLAGAQHNPCSRGSHFAGASRAGCGFRVRRAGDTGRRAAGSTDALRLLCSATAPGRNTQRAPASEAKGRVLEHRARREALMPSRPGATC